MPTKVTADGLAQLKKGIKDGGIGNLYVFYGPESYLKEYYLQEVIKLLVDDTFRMFNLEVFEGKALTPELLSNAIEGCPAMAERKVVVVKDFDLYKPPAGMQEALPTLLTDLPEYICLIFYYDILELKQDKRLKIHTLLSKNACFVEFSERSERELIDWVRRRFRALGKGIDDETCSYFLFLCGHSMTQLITETEKAAAFSTLEYITQYHIYSVCTRVLDAVIFDLTDAIADRSFSKAISIFEDLIAQKNDEIQIFSSIMRHLQRLYAAKLASQAQNGERILLEISGTRSSYYARKLIGAARGLSLGWLRKAILSAAETDAALKSSSADKQKLVEFMLLNMATGFEG